MEQITSLQHPLVKYLAKLRKNKDYRYDHQAFIVEGKKIINELNSSVKIKTLLITDESLLTSHSAEKIVLTNHDVLQKISSQCHPEGILAEIEIPTATEPETITHLVVFDQVNDPGNLGTLLRSAVAFGWDAAFILEGSCDPYNPKTVAAARGATFQIPLFQGDQQQLLTLLEKHQLTTYVADTTGEPPNQLAKKEKVALILGNEARGPSGNLRKSFNRIAVPMQEEVESLNVAMAGSILMYEGRKF